MGKRKDKGPKIKLAQPDRSGPSEKTLLDLAQERNLFEQADQAQARNRKKKQKRDEGASDADDEDEDDQDGEIDPTVDYIMDCIFWSISLAMLHFTLDVLVQHQFAIEISWLQVVKRSLSALLVFLFLVYTLHRHPGNTFLFGIPQHFQSHVRQAIFFTASVVCGCKLIYITNKFGYLHVMKQSPALGCVWVWSVIEMNLSLACVSLLVDGAYLWWAGFGLMS